MNLTICDLRQRRVIDATLAWYNLLRVVTGRQPALQTAHSEEAGRLTPVTGGAVTKA